MRAKLPGWQQEQQIRAQGLPVFRPDDPKSDLLFGYDKRPVEERIDGQQINRIIKLEDASQPSSQSRPRYGNESQNRGSRQGNRDWRR